MESLLCSDDKETCIHIRTQESESMPGNRGEKEQTLLCHLGVYMYMHVCMYVCVSLCVYPFRHGQKKKIHICGDVIIYTDVHMHVAHLRTSTDQQIQIQIQETHRCAC